MTNPRSLALMLFGACLLVVGAAQAGQPLETESARLMKRATFKVEGGFERQTSAAGTEFATPFAFEASLTDRLELTIEPVAYTAIRDKGTRRQVGQGDLEVTLTSLLRDERGGLPALALAAEVKLPTARNNRIGTGKTDYSLSLLASKHARAWDTHANVGYTIIGKPAGVVANNTMSFAVAEELRVSPGFVVVGEVFGSTAAVGESGAEGAAPSAESQLTPELSGGEIVAALGLQMHAARGMTYSVGLSIDGNRAVLVHPGISIAF